MPTIYPFRGYRFDPARVGSLSRVVTQPYDKIPEELRLQYLERSEYNIVRVIRNPDYAGAARFLDDWIGSGVLRRDPEPALYACEQAFDFEGQRWSRAGLIALVSLEDRDLVVKGHERVLDKPLADRLQLIRHTRANEGLIFTLFSDPALAMDTVLRQIREQTPSAEAVDDYGVTHRLWAVAEAGTVRRLQHAVQGRPLYIADGHHRFQTSVTYYRECLDAGLKPAGPESFDKRMVALFNMEAEGLRILPTHRGIANLRDFDLERTLAALARDFRIRSADLADLPAEMEAGAHRLGLVFREPGRFSARILELRPERLADPAFLPGITGPLRTLDVTILHEGILGPVLGLDRQAVAGEGFVRYYRERGELVDAVMEGRIQLGFLLRPTSLEQVRQASEMGEKMPQKSTDFYPKLLTGMVLMKMEMAESGRM